MTAVLSESVLDQYGPKWSKRPFWSKCPYSEPDFSIKWTKMDQNGPKWSILWPGEVHFGPSRSANRTLAIPELRPAEPDDFWGNKPEQNNKGREGCEGTSSGRRTDKQHIILKIIVTMQPSPCGEDRTQDKGTSKQIGTRTGTFRAKQTS